MTYQRASVACAEPGCDYEFHLPAGSMAAADAVYDGWRCHLHREAVTTDQSANDVLLDLLQGARELTPEDRAAAIESYSGYVGACVAFGNRPPLALLIGLIELLQATDPKENHDG